MSLSPLERVLDRKLVAILRSSDGDLLVDVAEALLAGGVEIIEVTFTVPKAPRVIERVADRLGERILLGAGTVLDAATARTAILAGAEYIVTPVVRREVIDVCRRYGKLAMPGALTPTEILAAWEAGGDIIKVFPSEITGPEYLKAVRAPLPQVRLMPTGGVNLQTAPAYLSAGACALGVGSALVEAEALARRDLARIENLARQFVALLASNRAG